MARSTSPRRTRLTYQPALDGLRGVAVAAVLCFHSGMSWLPGGELGVDLFFVLSGFLITTLLLVEFERDGEVSLGRFWARRIRRLFPALVLVLVGIAAYTAFAADPSTRSSIRIDALATLTYWANWRFVFSHQSYFASFGLPSPLRHMWSLSVEEQWYVVWPPGVVALLWVTRRRIERLLPLLMGLTIISVAVMAIVASRPSGIDHAYYGTDTRVQTLLIGALLAVVLQRWPVHRREMRGVVQMLGLVGAVFCGVVMATQHGNSRWMFRGGYALFALAGASVVAAVMMPRAGVVKRALRVPPLVWLGRISYGLYLWHWPIDVWLSPPRVHLSHWPLFGVRTAIALAISIASYFLVEQPIRRQRIRFRRPQLTLAGAAGSVAALLVFATVIGSGGQRVVAATAKGRSLPTVPSNITIPPTTVPQVPIPPVPPGRDIRVMVVGDSTGWTLSWALPKMPGIEIHDSAYIGCGLLPDARFLIDGQTQGDAFLPECLKQDQRWIDGLQTKPDIVVMSWGAWEVYDQIRNGVRLKAGSKAWRDALLAQFQTDVDFLNRYSRARIVLLDVPCYRELDPSLGGPTSDRNNPQRLKAVQDVFNEAARRNAGQVTVLPISEWLCPGGVFQDSRDGIQLRPDGVHVDQQAAVLTWKAWLTPRLEAIARQPGAAPAASGAEPVPPPTAAPTTGVPQTTTRKTRP